MQHECSPNTGLTFLDFAMCASTALTIYRESISLRAASPVSHIAPQASDKVLPMTATSGPSSPESFASFGPDGSWLKTSQGYSQLTLEGFSEPFLGTWPRSGMVSNGIAYKLPTLAPRISGTGCTSWPTPQTQYDGRSMERWQIAKERAAAKHKSGQYGKGTGAPGMIDLQRAVQLAECQMWPTPNATDGDWQRDNKGRKLRRLTLTGAVKLWPTPNATGWKNRESSTQHASLSKEIGPLNPMWVEWLMGFPLDWSCLEDE